MSQRSAILAKNVPVLVRGEHDGFYYHGTVKEEMEVSNSLCAVVMRVGVMGCALLVRSVHLQVGHPLNSGEVGEVSVAAGHPSACGKD